MATFCFVINYSRFDTDADTPMCGGFWCPCALHYMSSDNWSRVDLWAMTTDSVPGEIRLFWDIQVWYLGLLSEITLYRPMRDRDSGCPRLSFRYVAVTLLPYSIRQVPWLLGQGGLPNGWRAWPVTQESGDQTRPGYLAQSGLVGRTHVKKKCDCNGYIFLSYWNSYWQSMKTLLQHNIVTAFRNNVKFVLILPGNMQGQIRWVNQLYFWVK